MTKKKMTLVAKLRDGTVVTKKSVVPYKTLTVCIQASGNHLPGTWSRRRELSEAYLKNFLNWEYDRYGCNQFEHYIADVVIK